MKKNIKKYININSVFKIISIIMKSYYLNEENSKSKTNNFEEIKNNLNDLKKVNDKQNEINKSKTAYKRVQSFYNPIFRPKMNNVKKKFRYKFSIDGDTSSNIRLVDNSHYLYKDFDKKYSLININKNNQYSSIFNKIIINDKETPNKVINRTIGENPEISKRESKIFELKIFNLVFGKKLYNYFKSKFYKDFEFTESREFQLSNSFYRFIKIQKKNLKDNHL